MNGLVRCRILHHREADGCWADSPDVEGWSVAGDTYAEVVKLAEEGVPFALGHDAALELTARWTSCDFKPGISPAT